MDYVILIISMLAALTGGVLKKHSVNSYTNRQVMYQVFNCVVSLTSAVLLLVIGGVPKISPFTALLGIGFGLVTALQMIAILKAYENGPYSYTAVLVSLSTIIPTFSGYFIWGESIAPVQLLGVALMLVSFVCSVDFGKEEKTASSFVWILCVAVGFLTTGFIGVMQKWHQHSEFKSELDGFLILAFIISFVYSVICLAIHRAKCGTLQLSGAKSDFGIKSFVIMLICGACVAANNKMNLYLSGVMDSAVFFPVVNGGGLILSLVAALIIFKERLSTKKWIGVLVGIAAVVLLCNPF